jgi:cell pole-organizing protein PopZ
MAVEFDAVFQKPVEEAPLAPAAEFDVPTDVFDLDSAALEVSAAAATAAFDSEEPPTAKAEATEAGTVSALDEPATPAIEQAAAALALASASEPQRSAIISEEAGRQVTASFSELAEAIAARGRKSLDEVAEDLMRPILQDWLDNNLPTMVERLVREEIERIARGTGA